MTESEFRLDQGLRSELHAALTSRAFQEAVNILSKRRQNNEAKMDAMSTIDAIASVRLQSQRVGFDGLLNDLIDLCEPTRIAIPLDESTFGEDEAYKKLQQMENQE